ncbi:uncharacterized protein LOC110807561 isoform X3 [Carica papaya]|uniref:uncharacterized protein LOC110807561 isoform X3 n=1 Tax=Carica papaya TaxID=3649 RepID=UPI000B8C9A36|nr:uncharacterized protein LOC110807561 isoform X3 [Carica papaya]
MGRKRSKKRGVMEKIDQKSPMAQQKMQCALGRTRGDNQKTANGENNYSSRKSLEQENSKALSQDFKISSVTWRNTDQRCTVLTFLMPELDGNLRVVALPLQYFNDAKHLRSGCQKVPSRGATFPVKSFATRNFPPPNWQRNRTSIKKANEFSGNSSCQHCLTCNGSSALIPKGTNAMNSPDTDKSIGGFKKEMAAKKNTKSKGRKKQKKKKRDSCESDPTEIQVLPSTCGSSKSEIFGNKETDNGDGLVSHDRDNIINSKGNSNSVIEFSELSKKSRPDVEVVDVSVVQSYTQAQPFTCDINRRLEETHIPEISCHDKYDLQGSNSLTLGSKSADTGNSLILGSKCSKKIGRSSSIQKLGGHPGHTGKENNHVWQRVQRNDSDLKKSSSECSQLDPLLERSFNVAKINAVFRIQDKKKSKHRVVRKLKRKINVELKQEENIYFSRDSHRNTVHGSDAHGDTHIQKNEKLASSALVNSNKGILTNTYPGCPVYLKLSNTNEYMNSKSVQVCPGDLESHYIDSNAPCTQNVECQDASLPKSRISLNKSNLVIINEVSQREKKTCRSENSKQNHGSGSILQKWVPVVIKDPDLTMSIGSGSSSLEISEDWSSGNSIEEKVDSTSQDLLSSENIGIEEFEKLDEDESRNQKLRSLNSSMLKEHAAANWVPGESEKNSVLTADSDEIGRAVRDACRVQVASKAVGIETGSQIGEFEKFLHLSSPVVSNINLIPCTTCVGYQIGRKVLCRHERPNIPLGTLWQWYEEHGSYGLQVKAENYEDTKRLGRDLFEFSAYFVPYLSAVQLFKNFKHHSIKDKNGLSIHQTSEKKSDVDHPPTYSAVVPKLHTTDTSIPLHVNSACEESYSLSNKESSSVPTFSMAWSGELELLFEYFESEKPWQRRPLYEKVQDLVRGNVPSECTMYGDPANLNSINIHELHPGSWYSVAWYPIYRIPDGNFSAAFLTYHSLGHLVPRSTKFKCQNMCVEIESPVVGLQSYNAQLKRAGVNQRAEREGLSLKERLRTLEKTASVMARAVVMKGKQICRNRHPDFEFFVSRKP